jgi:hypothetical protein
MNATEILHARTPSPALDAWPAFLQRTGMISLGDVFCLLVPLLQFLRFEMVGETCVSDLLVLAVFPIVVLRHPERLRQRPIPAILTLGLFWLVAQIATDFLRHSAPADYLRGWTRIALLLANFVVVWVVACRSRRRFLLYGAGIAIGVILAFFVSPTDQALMSPWKFALGGPVTILVVIWISIAARNRGLGILLPLTALAVLHAFEDVRSLAAITFLTAVFCVFHWSAAAGQQRLGRSRLVFLAFTIACGIWGFSQAYSHYAEQGVFGEYAQRKLLAQTSGAGGLLLGGRGEILASEQAILDSPLLGHGSWARDPVYAAILSDKRAELGYKDFQGGKPDDLIPAHSHVFGAWVESGVVGALFWLFVLGYTVRALLRVSGSEPILPLFAFTGFCLVWDIFFSPLGPGQRFSTPYAIASMIVLTAFRNAPALLAEET